MHVCDLTYWMAPEVIEMRGPGDDPKSDVWSVACVVIELLTGAPPYFEMQPMPALFAGGAFRRASTPDSALEVTASVSSIAARSCTGSVLNVSPLDISFECGSSRQRARPRPGCESRLPNLGLYF